MGPAAADSGGGVHVDVVVGGVPVSLLDTAGMREASDVVERLGVERSRAAAAAADITIIVLDAQVGSPSPKGGCGQYLLSLA